MAKVTKQISKSNKFEPNKAYKWNPDDIFEITGQQFASIYHALNAEVTTTAGATIAQKYEAYSVMLDVFKDGVEQGVIVESELPEVIAVEEDKGIKKLFDN